MANLGINNRRLTPAMLKRLRMTGSAAPTTTAAAPTTTKGAAQGTFINQSVATPTPSSAPTVNNGVQTPVTTSKAPATSSTASSDPSAPTSTNAPVASPNPTGSWDPSSANYQYAKRVAQQLGLPDPDQYNQLPKFKNLDAVNKALKKGIIKEGECCICNGKLYGPIHKEVYRNIIWQVSCQEDYVKALVTKGRRCNVPYEDLYPGY